jgi:hypothetical protein
MHGLVGTIISILYVQDLFCQQLYQVNPLFSVSSKTLLEAINEATKHTSTRRIGERVRTLTDSAISRTNSAATFKGGQSDSAVFAMPFNAIKLASERTWSDLLVFVFSSEECGVSDCFIKVHPISVAADSLYSYASGLDGEHI